MNGLDFIDNKINGNAALDFLLLNKVEHRENSIFDGVLELFPAHNFTLNLSTSQFKSGNILNRRIINHPNQQQVKNMPNLPTKRKNLLKIPFVLGFDQMQASEHV